MILSFAILLPSAARIQCLPPLSDDLNRILVPETHRSAVVAQALFCAILAEQGWGFSFESHAPPRFERCIRIPMK